LDEQGLIPEFFSLYVIDRRRFTEFHPEAHLGARIGSDGEWVLGEEHVQKIFSKPKPSLRQRLFGSR
jgi:hypothetical protein